MTSAVSSLQSLVEWCDVPAPADVRGARIVRFWMHPRGDAGPLYYYGTLSFARTHPGQLRFDGVGVAAIDPRFESLAVLPGFNEWFIRVNVILFPHSGQVAVGQTFCDWDNSNFSAGAELRSIEADAVVPLGDGALRVTLAGREWQLSLARSTVRGF
jgi:hypothetical protein